MHGLMGGVAREKVHTCKRSNNPPTTSHAAALCCARLEALQMPPSQETRQAVEVTTTQAEAQQPLWRGLLDTLEQTLAQRGHRLRAGAHVAPEVQSHE
jgi:hypothetical protein